MKKTIVFLLAIIAAYSIGLVHGDAASRTRRVVVDLSRKANSERIKDGDREYTAGKAEDGREITIIWRN